MKILLAYPYCLEERIHEEDVRVPPIGLYNVAATLIEAGHDVVLANFQDKKGKMEDIRRVIAGQKPDLVGISILNANRSGGIEIARIVKQIAPRTPVVLGGVGATFLWKLLLRHFPEIDYVVVGEGDHAFAELVGLLQKGDEKGAAAVPGIARRSNGAAVCNPLPPPIDDLDALADPSRYFTFSHVVSSRGCPSNCRFCGSPKFWQRRVRFHSPSYFVDQIERLHRKGVDFFFVSDDTFTLKPKRVIDICRRMLDRGLKTSWASISRVDRVDEKMLFWMRKAGCIQISYGVEHGSPKIRRALGKHFSDEQVRRAFALTTGYGIMARAYFIYGCPGETDRTVDQTIELVRQIRPLSAIFYLLALFPGTALYEDYRKRRGLGDEIWLKNTEDILYFETDPRLSRQKVLSFGRRLRSTFYRELPGFAESVELVENPDLALLHADFLSRLGLTFTHGDYVAVKEVPAKEQTAEGLFKRALSYHPDHRAYLGLGILAQRRRDFAGSIRALAEGIEHFPNSEALHTCMGLDYMNLGDFRNALTCFVPFEGNGQVEKYIAECRKKL
ncbi:MAG: cobalamin-dependent protein [Desulfobacterales bacterium]|nr:cobalamin-dependent protein [Desulfobacterales bacterium]